MSDDFDSFVKSLNSDALSKMIIDKKEEVPIEAISKRCKILIVSTHINQINGYSKVAFNMIKELCKEEWIDIVHFGTQKLNVDIGRKNNIKVKSIDATSLDKGKNGMGFAFPELIPIIKSEKPDIVFIYNDLAVISAYIEEIRKNIQVRDFKIWAYVDLAYKAQPQQFIDILNRDVERVFCFTQKWKEELKQQGITRPVDVMMHGIDLKLHRRIPKELARQTVGLPKDIILFSSYNRNQPRKRLDIVIMAFVELITRYPAKPIFMLMIADKGEKGGYSLFDIFARELKNKNVSTELYGNRLLLTNKETCYTDDDMNMFNNIGDVGINCSEGEGFGLCAFDQMAVGVPQIVPNINGYNEYCTDANSLLVEPKWRSYIPQGYNVISGEAHIVDYIDVANAMDKYVSDEELRKIHSRKAQESVTKYTWEESVKPLIKRLRNVTKEDD